MGEKREQVVFEGTFPVICKICKVLYMWTDFEPRINDVEPQFVCIPCFDEVKVDLPGHDRYGRHR